MIGTSHDPFQPSEYTTSLLTVLLAHCAQQTVSRFLEIGVGSGVLSLAVAKTTGAQGVALDIDEDALLRSRIMFEHAGVENVEIRDNSGGGAFAALKPDERFDLIFSNPPAYPGVNLLPTRKQHWHGADPSKPFEFYKAVLAGASERLAEAGCMILTHPSSFAIDELRSEAAGAGLETEIVFEKLVWWPLEYTAGIALAGNPFRNSDFVEFDRFTFGKVRVLKLSAAA